MVATDDVCTTIFAGSPGVGKTALVNAMAGRVIFDSGAKKDAYLTGLTRSLQLHHVSPTEVLGDTPGLDNPKQREEAGRVITEALKRGGRYRIVFVVSLKQGRVSPQDATTIRVILEAVKRNDQQIPFAIIINSVGLKLYERIVQQCDDVLEKTLITYLLGCTTRSTEHFLLLPKEQSLFGKSNVLPPDHMTENVREFLNTVPFSTLAVDKVDDIDTRSFNTILREYATKMSQMAKDEKLMEEMYAQKMEEAQREADARHRTLQADIEKTIEMRRQALRETEEIKQKDMRDTAQAQLAHKESEEEIQRLNEQLEELKRNPPKPQVIQRIVIVKSRRPWYMFW